MSILPAPTKVEFDENLFWVSLEDGRKIGVPLAWYPRLLKGTSDGRSNYFLSPSGIHWETLDEDISIEAILNGRMAFDGKQAA